MDLLQRFEKIDFSQKPDWRSEFDESTKINFLVAGGGSIYGVGGRVVKRFVSRADPWQLFRGNLGESEEDGYSSKGSR